MISLKVVERPEDGWRPPVDSMVPGDSTTEDSWEPCLFYDSEGWEFQGRGFL